MATAICGRPSRRWDRSEGRPSPASVRGAPRRKSPADVAREALVAAGLSAPNQRLFGINDPYAWELFRPEPSMLPPFPPCWLPRVERDQK